MKLCSMCSGGAGVADEVLREEACLGTRVVMGQW